MQPNPIHKALAAIDLEPGASWEEIVARHKVLVRFWHSDKARVEDRQIADKEMARFNHARDVLKEHYQSNEHHGGVGCLCKPSGEGGAAAFSEQSNQPDQSGKSDKSNTTDKADKTNKTNRTSGSERTSNYSGTASAGKQTYSAPSANSSSNAHPAGGKVSRFYNRLSPENKVAVKILAFFAVLILVGGSLRILFPSRDAKPIESDLSSVRNSSAARSAFPKSLSVSGTESGSVSGTAPGSEPGSEPGSVSAPILPKEQMMGGEQSLFSPAYQPVQKLVPNDQFSVGSSRFGSDVNGGRHQDLERVKALSVIDRYERAVKKNEENIADLDNAISGQRNSPARLRQLNDFRAERLRQLEADRASLKEARLMLEELKNKDENGKGEEGERDARALELLNRHERRRN
ncbi:MAG: hypothetical protein K2Y32_12800 [Candidatus Obscuribacterales bacterium]|nr:hypothetical protein [Candidatus Obscuribacterales bacterium]